MISIDGRYGEGGGQIIRTSVALSAITQQPTEIFNIRAGRAKPGLHAQHLTAVKAAATLCNAELKGAEIGSLYLHFTPQAMSAESNFHFQVGTAGATGLVTQTALLPMLWLPSRPANLTVEGGTHVPMAPIAEYIEFVYLSMLRRMGMEVQFSYDKSGFFPKGGGKIQATVGTSGLFEPLQLTERGKLQQITVITITTQLAEHVAERCEQALLKDLKGYGVPLKFEWRDKKGVAPGAAVILIAETENVKVGFSVLGERGKPIERVAQEAYRDFVKWFQSRAVVEEHLADQLALPCAFVAAESVWTTPTVTEHLRTVLHIIQQFLPITYSIEETQNGMGEVRLKGVALKQG